MGGGGSLMTQSAGSLTTQSKAFNNVMASEPYRYTCYLKQVMQVCNTIRLTVATGNKVHTRAVFMSLDNEGT